MTRMTTLLATAALLAVSSQANPDEPHSGLNDQGFITSWLLLAAIPLEEDVIQALDTPQIKEEAKLRPKAGDKVMVGDHELVWTEYNAKEYFFDFNDFLGIRTLNSVGYAACYIRADAEMKDIQLKIGSDDQAKVYLNGTEVFKQGKPRPLLKDEDSVNVTLIKGVNVLVFKVVNQEMNWSGCARFTNKVSQIIKDLKVTASAPSTAGEASGGNAG
jgi:hypothetical protein